MKSRLEKRIDKVFGPVYGKPSWNVRQGYGSSLTFEFGDPHLEIREPQVVSSFMTSKLRQLYARRRVFIYGDWHLWIYCCAWKLFFDAGLLCQSESPRKRIEKALKNLDGQALINVTVNPKNSATVFQFDLGGRLETRRYRRDLISDQWMFFEPTGKVFYLLGSGILRHQQRKLAKKAVSAN